MESVTCGFLSGDYLCGKVLLVKCELSIGSPPLRLRSCYDEGVLLSTIKVLALTKYGCKGASSRMRFIQYSQYLSQQGLDVTLRPLISDEMLRQRYDEGGYKVRQLIGAYAVRCLNLFRARKFDLIWVEKEALQWWPLWLEQLLLGRVPFVLDYDDAVFHSYDQHPSTWVRRFYGHRLDRLMAKAKAVVVGNEYLAGRARAAGSSRIEVIPTVIDLERYPIGSQRVASNRLPRVVWIGSPATQHYLEQLRQPLLELSRRQPFVFRVIGGDLDGLPEGLVEPVAWELSTEVQNIASADVGVMPLLDTPWERGKCGYKLIQFMACGLPVVASPVGVNTEIVEPGENGFLASSEEEWISCLEALLVDISTCCRMGAAGRKRVEEHFSLQTQAPRMAQVLRDAASA